MRELFVLSIFLRFGTMHGLSKAMISEGQKNQLAASALKVGHTLPELH
jgi:hypothetical protein